MNIKKLLLILNLKTVKRLLTLFIFLSWHSCYSQVNCTELMNNVKSSCDVTYTEYVTDSSILQKVTLYEDIRKENNFFAIAKMNGKDYLFCNISVGDYFNYVSNLAQLGPNPPSKSERFHTHIFSYECDCS